MVTIEGWPSLGAKAATQRTNKCIRTGKSNKQIITTRCTQVECEALLPWQKDLISKMDPNQAALRQVAPGVVSDPCA